MRPLPLVAGLTVLAGAWAGLAALPGFAVHMAAHMAVVAVAAPLLALAVTGTGHDPARRWPARFAPVPAAMLEMVVVWGWHAPALHAAARAAPLVMAGEQAMFLASGLYLWTSALGRAGAGALGLLITAMHMALLGVLLAVAPRALYAHGHPPTFGLSPLADQHLGGVVMLVVGGLGYLAGGVALAARLLRQREAQP